MMEFPARRRITHLSDFSLSAFQHVSISGRDFGEPL
jgi:hypothetical protein